MPGTCSAGATGTLYWKGAGSNPFTETDLAGNVQNNYIFFNGQRVARSDSAGAMHYYFSNNVGSHAVVENATGSACEQDIDYYPYGGQVGGPENDYCPTPVPQHYKFTGKERDAESNLDDFGARYFASSMGRFMTPDWAARPTSIPYAVFGDPQSLNLYTYVRNDPVSSADADGHCSQCLQYPNQYYPGQGLDAGYDAYAAEEDRVVVAQSSAAVTAQNTVTAATVGAVIGGVGGAIVGGIAGAAGGTLVEPGGGTIVGGGLGGAEGAKDGAALGALIGATLGIIYSEAKDAVTGPKAADAPGVTAGGQATDAHGNKLGPSGETQVDRTRSNTREGARNRALGEGSGAVEHSNPRVGSRHWHPTDAQGNKKPSSTHHEYPDE